MKNLLKCNCALMRTVWLWVLLAASAVTAHAAWYIYGEAPFGGWNVNNGLKMTASGLSSEYRAVANLTSESTLFTFSTGSGSWDDGTNAINNNRWGAYNDQVWTATVGSDFGTKKGKGNVKVEATGYHLFVFNESGSDTHNLRIAKADNCYLFGAIASKNIGWNPTQGFAMTTSDHITFTATDVVLAEGDNFRFTLQTSASSSDWTTANASTFGPNGGSRAVAEGTVQLSNLNNSSNNFTVTAANAGTYTITVNIVTAKVTFVKKITSLYLFSNHGGDWDLTNSHPFTISGSTASISGVELDRADYYTLATNYGSWDNINAGRYGPEGTTSLTAESGVTYNTVSGTEQSFQPAKTGVWSFAFNLNNSQLTPSLTAATAASQWFMVHSTGINNFDYAHPVELTRDGNTFTCTQFMTSGDYFIFAQQVGSDWEGCIRYTNASGDVDPVNAGTAYTASRHGTGAYKVGTTGIWTLTYNYLTDQWSAAVEPVNVNTGELYMIGAVNGTPWASNAGLKMKANSDNTVFTLENVQIVAGAEFAFATKLGTIEGDWATLNAYRFTSDATGDTKFLVTDAMTNHDSPTQLTLQQRQTYDRNFQMQTTGRYDVTVDWTNKKVTIARTHDPLYMFYGDHWSSNGGVVMNTTDGNIYTLANVVLGPGDSFQFTKELGATWEAISTQRMGAKNGPVTIHKESIGTAVSDAMEQGSDKDFKMGTDVVSGHFRVAVNLSENTVTLFRMAEVNHGEVIIYLEQTPNVDKPVLWAYDKERDYEDKNYVHTDRIAREDFFNGGNLYDPETNPNPRRKAIIDGGAPNAEEITTADGRKWWKWVLETAIADFWFTRNDYDYASHKLTDEDNVDMTDINWRHAGELYFTWPSNSNTLSEYTRDYYESAAQEIADCAVMIDGHLYAYFTNTPGWSQVFCHSWYTDAEGENHDLLNNEYNATAEHWYPGAPCELIGYDKDGYEVWRIDLTAHGVTEETYPVGIIFDNGVDNANDVQIDYGTGLETTEPKEQTGDFKYSNGAAYDYCGIISLGRSLGNIIAQGVVHGPTYVIEDDIVGVYYDPLAVTEIEVDGTTYTYNGALYCKDLNKFTTTKYVEKSLQEAGQVDYMRTYYNGNNSDRTKDRYDQSNWVKLVFSTQYKDVNVMNDDDREALLKSYVGRILPGGTVEGQLVNNVNPEMRLASIQIPDGLPAASGLKENLYYEAPNIFITCNFVGNQGGKAQAADGTMDQRAFDFFFVTPKPEEFATVTWATWDGTKFIVPKRQHREGDGSTYPLELNGFNLKGSFEVDWSMCTNDGANIVQVNQVYEFPAIIKLKEESSAAGAAPRRVGDITSVEVDQSLAQENKYMVFPLSIDGTTGVVTAVDELAAKAQPVSTTYVNTAGQVSSKPWSGVNIVVTTMSDGSNRVSKVLR